MNARFLRKALSWTILIFPLAFLIRPALADGPADNLADKVRRVPPPGIKISEANRAELESGVADLGKEIQSLQISLADKPALAQLLPDVQIFHKAVDWALRYDEFFRSNEVQTARSLLKLGADRARNLREGRAPWLTATGLVVRGYASKIDGSVQPYGLVVPGSFVPNDAPRRLDFWFHGRGENLTELDFINGRLRSPGEFVPPNAFVLHLYGRYCNGNRFAGETDLFEALEHAKKFYAIDENRLVIRGFSLGGAACWHFATQHSWRWAAAAPGAGFSETADFLKVFQNETLQPTWWEQKLWHMYDAIDYAVNVFNCPLVAYSGEIDRQKQAADMMAKALAEEGIDMVHIIGPKTAHAYHPQAKIEINRRLDAIAAHGRNPVPEKIRFTTWTLRYNQMFWITLAGLEQHWERARVEAQLEPAGNAVRVTTKNVSALTIKMEPGQCPLDLTQNPAVVLDGQKLVAPRVRSDRSWEAHFAKANGRWQKMEKSGTAPPEGLSKQPGLQGPIDDAFMEAFIFVRPTGKALNQKTGAWCDAELAHAIDHWRIQFRGDARVKDDAEISESDIANNNLVLWGDPSSNQLLAKIADKMPARWTRENIQFAGRNFSSADHVAVLIYPNPLNPKRYVVLNSGFTFREYDYLNNARQTSKLPDWAVVDVNTPPSSRWPGKVVEAGFFDEQWKLTTK
jgi:hypothetical protein